MLTALMFSLTPSLMFRASRAMRTVMKILQKTRTHPMQTKSTGPRRRLHERRNSRPSPEVRPLICLLIPLLACLSSLASKLRRVIRWRPQIQTRIMAQGPRRRNVRAYPTMSYACPVAVGAFQTIKTTCKISNNLKTMKSSHQAITRMRRLRRRKKLKQFWVTFEMKRQEMMETTTGILTL